MPKLTSGTSPDSVRTAEPSACAFIVPVSAFVAPGPEVTMTTPSLPVARWYPSAA